MTTSRKILIIEKEEQEKNTLCALFADKFDILEADNGQKGVEILVEKSKSIDMILLNFSSSFCDTFLVLQQLTTMKLANKIPAVLFVSEKSTHWLKKNPSIGITEILRKSLDTALIKRNIITLIEQFSHKRNLDTFVEEQRQKLKNEKVEIVDILNTILQFKRAESVGHTFNIRIITRKLMNELSRKFSEYNFSDEFVNLIADISTMHDIGKVAITDKILEKTSGLTEEEKDVMKTHTVYGCEILEKIAEIRTFENYCYYYAICRYHHERWDGSGYPDRLLGEKIPIWAQVISLADVYDALTSKRVYKEAYTSSKAMQMILKGECGDFNPILIDSLLSIIPSLQNGIENSFVYQ